MDWEEALRVVEARASRVCWSVSKVRDWETASLSFLGMVMVWVVGCEDLMRGRWYYSQTWIGEDSLSAFIRGFLERC
jgi:hypothetical protein